MRNAANILIAGLCAAALAGCSKQQAQNGAANQSVETNLAAGQLPPNAEIETLPADESSGTSSTELNAGEDNPDVIEPSNAQ